MSLDDERDSMDESPQSIDPQLREQMERYIERNYRAEEIEPYPPEWLDDKERGDFCRLSEDILGEQRSDQWLQNKVFKGIGSDAFDFDRPLQSSEVAVAEPEGVQFDQFAREFLQTYSDFVDKVVKDLCKSPKFSNDIERVSDGMMAGIAYALNEPKPDNMDQRLNFLALFPENLSYEVICAFSEPQQASKLWLRVQDALTAVKFSVKKDEELTDYNRAEGWRSVFVARKKENGKDTVLRQLSLIAADSEAGAGDGLISYVGRIVARGGNKNLEQFIRFHIERRTLSARTKEGNRKKHEVTIFQDGEDGDMTVDAKISSTEEHTDNGVVVTSAGARHAYERSETYEERRQKAEKAKEVTTDTFYETVQLVDEIIASILGEAVPLCDQLIESGQPTNATHILGLLLPEALHYYIKAAVDQVNSLILPENEEAMEKAKKKGVRLCYKMGRSVISFTQGGRSDLGEVVDLNGLKRYLTPYTNAKTCIYDQYIRGKTKEQIAQENGIDMRLVEDTIRQIKVCWRSPVRQKEAVYAAHEEGKKPEEIAIEPGLSSIIVQKALATYREDKEEAEAKEEKLSGGKSKKGSKIGVSFRDYFADIDAPAVKNGFSWRWGRILQVLYAPLPNDPRNDALIESEARRIEFKLHTFKQMNEGRRRHLQELLAVYREGKRYEFLDKICSDERNIRLRRRIARLYTEKEPGALIDLSSLLPAHSYITEGTLPPKVFPPRIQSALSKLDKAGKKAFLDKPLSSLVLKDEYGDVDPGPAWGHNVCRATGESNLRMYYDIFHGGLRRENAEHKEVRRKAGMIIRMRRAKATKDGGKSGTNSGDSQAEPTV